MGAMKFFSAGIVLVALFYCNITAKAQSAEINKTDNSGLKQGSWKTYYSNGKPRYEGFFVDGKPTGTFKRYYESGAVKVIQQFEKVEKSTAQYFYENGALAAEGRYLGKEKDGTWSYYSYYEKVLRLTEPYNNGKLNGEVKKYHDGGKVAEVVMWVEGVRQGEWKQFYENGSVSMYATYVNDVRSGLYKSFYIDGRIQTEGAYRNDVPDGDWIYYNEDGSEKMRLKYQKGELLNKEQLEKMEQDFLNELEKNAGRIPEPSEDNFLTQ